MFQALSWSGLPARLGGGSGACLEWPAHIAVPNIAGDTVTIDGKDHKVIRVERLYRDLKKRKPASRICIVVSAEGGEKVAANG